MTKHAACCVHEPRSGEWGRCGRGIPSCQGGMGGLPQDFFKSTWVKWCNLVHSREFFLDWSNLAFFIENKIFIWNLLNNSLTNFEKRNMKLQQLFFNNLNLKIHSQNLAQILGHPCQGRGGHLKRFQYGTFTWQWSSKLKLAVNFP